MRLRTPRLLIRDWTEADVEPAFLIYSDPEVMRYLGTTGEPERDFDAFSERLRGHVERWKGQALGFWAVELAAGGELIGGALLKPLPGAEDVELGYHLRREHWGKGYATEVAAALVRYGFEEVGLRRIVGVTYPQNAASKRVLEKAGLSHRGKTLYAGAVEVDLFAIEAPEPPRPASGRG